MASPSAYALFLVNRRRSQLHVVSWAVEINEGQNKGENARTGANASSSATLSNSCTLAAIRATASLAACLVVFRGSGAVSGGGGAGFTRGGIVEVEKKTQRGKNAF